MFLNCHTYYSYKFGTLSLTELFEEAKAKNASSLVLTDVNSTSACLDFIRHCPEYNLKPIVGVDFRNGALQKYIGIARNNEGFKELNEHLSSHLHAEEDFQRKAPSFQNVYVVYPYGSVEYHELKENEFVGLIPSQLSKLLFSEWKNQQDKLLILQPVTFRHKRDFNVHRLLRTIDNNTLLSRLPKSEEAQPDEIMPMAGELEKLFHNYPRIIENTKRVIADCSIGFQFKTPKNKRSSYRVDCCRF